MKWKNLTTVVLLAFVGVSLVALVRKETRSSPAGTPAPTVETATAAPGVKLIAYYMHGKVRCPSCMDIETFAREAVESGFPDELRTGVLEWRIVNYEEPGNEHYAHDYKLAAPCVVLVSLRDGKQASWKSLPEVWEKFSDKPEFIKFVQQNVRELLADPKAGPAVGTAQAAVTASAKIPRLLDVGATKCIPCKMMAPVLEELRGQYKDRLTVDFIDVWENPDAAEKYDVSTIPTQIFFDAEGKERYRHIGFISKDDILRKWKELGVALDGESKAL